MKQSLYDSILLKLRTEAQTHAHSPDEILRRLQSSFPDVDSNTLKQIRQQWYSVFLKSTAASIYCYLDAYFSQHPGLVSAQQINEICEKFKSVPKAWLIKHILNKSNFSHFLRHNNFCRRKLDCRQFAELSPDNVMRYLMKQTFDFLSQLDAEIARAKQAFNALSASQNAESKSTPNQPESNGGTEAEAEDVAKKDPDASAEAVIAAANELEKLQTISKVVLKLLDVNTTDSLFGPRGNALLHYEGQVSEERIEKFLIDQQVSYFNENQQKEMGCDKTPDFLLQVPVIAKFDQDQKDPAVPAIEPMVICWIESKCMFGDRETVVKHYHEQLEAYYQRYGPGLIIYFRGFVEEVDLNFSNSSIRMLDALPSGLVKHSSLGL